MKAITQYICPPIPIRSHDWMAHFEGDNEDGPTGYGETEADALRDLAETLAERSAAVASAASSIPSATVTQASGSDEQQPRSVGAPAKGER